MHHTPTGSRWAVGARTRERHSSAIGATRTPQPTVQRGPGDSRLQGMSQRRPTAMSAPWIGRWSPTILIRLRLRARPRAGTAGTTPSDCTADLSLQTMAEIEELRRARSAAPSRRLNLRASSAVAPTAHNAPVRIIAGSRKGHTIAAPKGTRHPPDRRPRSRGRVQLRSVRSTGRPCSISSQARAGWASKPSRAERERAVFVESERDAARAIERNLDKLRLTGATVAPPMRRAPSQARRRGQVV